MKRLVRALAGGDHLRWVPSWIAREIVSRLGNKYDGPRHVLFAFCDHFEPLWHDADVAQGDARVRAWSEGYPAMAREHRDADGRPPRHTFFFPGEQYAPIYLERLAELARAGLGEVELHLHHDADTPATLRARLERHLADLAAHGHLARDPDGRLRYAFIHGNWCLANARRDGRWCGVDGELPILHATGCYADFTFPSAPDETQPLRCNRIHWPTGDLARRRAHEGGEPARVGVTHDDRLLLVDGPLALGWDPGRGPRLDAAAITARDPATPARVRRWVAQAIHVEGRPEWVFVKVHTHGAPEAEARSLLGDGGHALHAELAARFNDGRRHVLHYVTARELWNIAMAAMEGKRGDPSEWRDHVLGPPPVVHAAPTHSWRRRSAR